MVRHGSAGVDGTARTWSLRHEWSRAFTIMLVLLLVAAAAAIVGVRGLVDEVRGTARTLHRESVTVAALRTELVNNEEIAHQLLSDKPVDRSAFLQQQQQAISRRFADAATVLPATNGMRATVVAARGSWQKGLTTYALWGDQLQALHGDHSVDNPTFGASSDACGCRKLIRTADLRLCPCRGHRAIDLHNWAIHSNRPSLSRLSRRPRSPTAPTRGSNRFVVFAAVAAAGSSEKGSDFGTDRARRDASGRLRETPAQESRTSFRHPHGPTPRSRWRWVSATGNSRRLPSRTSIPSRCVSRCTPRACSSDSPPPPHWSSWSTGRASTASGSPLPTTSASDIPTAPIGQAAPDPSRLATPRCP
jgi:hypothetical protein